MYQDLREWIQQADALGEIKHVQGAHWNLEMGGITEIVCRAKEQPPAILFDHIPDYPTGHRALFGQLGTLKRLALSLGLPLDLREMGFVRTLRDRIRDLHLVKSTLVKDSPASENVQEGDEVDLYKFPVPVHHELDGGRYFGTGHLVVTRDPDDGWVNAGTYRLMLLDRNTLGFYISPGKHGSIHRQKYFERGQPCPVAVAIGADPAIWFASTMEVPFGVCEYEYAGGLTGQPAQVIEGELTGLPLPATSEIILEGESYPGDLRDEGPFGEWTGYYAGRGRKEPTIVVKRVMHRTNPILTCAQPARPPSDHVYRAVVRSALIWDELEKVGIPDVQGVWCHPAGGSRMLTIVSIKQRYAGHSRQAGAIAAQCPAGAYMGRFVIVVDEDIDPSNTYDVLWALSSRADPERDIDIMRKALGSKLDPLIHKDNPSTFNSRAIIDATRPYDWKDDFPPVVESSPDLKKKLFAKFPGLLD